LTFRSMARRVINADRKQSTKRRVAVNAPIIVGLVSGSRARYYHIWKITLC
jgi:hypothetical protein